MSTTQPHGPWDIETESLYRILIDTRNLEVNLFWQRANYFLVLNSGIVLAFFNVKEPIHVRVFAAMGILVSLLWFWVLYFLAFVLRVHWRIDSSLHLPPLDTAACIALASPVWARLCRAIRT